MNEPIHSNMKVDLVHFMTYPSVIKGSGYQGICLQALAKKDIGELIREVLDGKRTARVNA